MPTPITLKNRVLANHFADAYHRGEADRPNFASEGSDAATNCAMCIELEIDDEKVLAAWFEAEGCAVCESIASLAMEAVEGKSCEQVAELTLPMLLSSAAASDDDTTQNEDAAKSTCAALPIRILHQAIRSPLDALDDDLADGASFGGPSLREEC